jgi:hypothetical protein
VCATHPIWPLHHNRTATSDHGYGKLITFAEFARLPPNSYSASGLILRRSV